MSGPQRLREPSVARTWNCLGVAVVAALLVTSGCAGMLEPVPVDGPGPPPVETEVGEPGCHEYCKHLADLEGEDGGQGCEAGRDTPAGSTCLDFCQATLDAGQDLHVQCVLAVQSCAEVDSASQGCGT